MTDPSSFRTGFKFSSRLKRGVAEVIIEGVDTATAQTKDFAS